MSMDLQSRLAEGLTSAGWTVIDRAYSALSDSLTFGADPVVMVRTSGLFSDPGGLREEAEVVLILGLSDDEELRSGRGVQGRIVALVKAVDEHVDSAFPQIGSVDVDYEWEAAQGLPPLVAAHFRCVGGWVG